MPPGVRKGFLRQCDWNFECRNFHRNASAERWPQEVKYFLARWTKLAKHSRALNLARRAVPVSTKLIVPRTRINLSTDSPAVRFEGRIRPRLFTNRDVFLPHRHEAPSDAGRSRLSPALI
jgi:hypothetical protein